MQRNGFSLIELLVALGILAVVASVIMPKFLDVRKQASYTSTVAQQQKLQEKAQLWISLGGRFVGSQIAQYNYGVYGPSSPLVLLLAQNPRTDGTPRQDPLGACIDSIGIGGSSTISLGVPLSGAFPGPNPGFWNGWADTQYYDGAGTDYDVWIDPLTGKVEFQPVRGYKNDNNPGPVQTKMVGEWWNATHPYYETYNHDRGRYFQAFNSGLVK